MRITKRQLKRIIREEYSKIKKEQRLSESRRHGLRESMGSSFMNYVDAAAGQNLVLRQHGSHAGDGLGFFSDGRLLFAMYDLEDDFGVVSDDVLDAIMDSAGMVRISGEDYFEYLQGYKHRKLKMI